MKQRVMMACHEHGDLFERTLDDENPLSMMVLNMKCDRCNGRLYVSKESELQ